MTEDGRGLPVPSADAIDAEVARALADTGAMRSYGIRNAAVRFPLGETGTPYAWTKSLDPETA